jgi:hypothetical protein
MASKQFDHLQESSLLRLRALIPSECPLLVRRDAPSGFVAYTFDERDAQRGRYQVVAAFIAGYVASWRRVRPAVDAVSRTWLPATTLRNER